MASNREKSSSAVDTESRYVEDFRRRFVHFERARKAEMHHMKHDFIARFFADHFVLGNKSTYDGLLQGMLTDEEHQRLETDRDFTRAWRIFVDLCWLRKSFERAAYILGGIILLLAIVALLIWALPHVVGPGDR